MAKPRGLKQSFADRNEFAVNDRVHCYLTARKGRISKVVRAQPEGRATYDVIFPEDDRVYPRGRDDLEAA
jgi:hypothetical protein